uniref:Uncharacterized protein n=1 Tax=Arundo donax TaxID=35708 RepID=A0A0A9FI32_ARUDO
MRRWLPVTCSHTTASIRLMSRKAARPWWQPRKCQPLPEPCGREKRA